MFLKRGQCIMKKIAVLVLTALVVLMLASACGGGHKVTRIVTPTPTPTATASPEPAGETGTLSSVTGDVQVLRHDASAWLAATSGMEIWTGDNLKTGSDGYVLITFFDGSVMEMNASAEISVEELSVASGGSTTVHINQVIGNTVNRVESLVDSSSTYEVETPAGSAVVRGTIEVIQVATNGSTTVSIQDEGDVEEHLAYFTAGGVTVTIGEGMTSSCEVGGIPETPFYTSIICISQDVYNLLHDEFQNAVAAYMIAHSGALPPTVGEITIDGETRYLFEMCSLRVANGGILNIISETGASVLCAGNDNCDLNGCSCNTTGQYVWALD